MGVRSGKASGALRAARLSLASVLVAACSREAAAPPTRLTGTPIAVADSPRLRLGVIEGDTLLEFDRVATPFLLADGRLVVPLRGKSTLRVFAPGGTLQATLGRAGEGPGEFKALLTAWARGDTLEAFDAGLRRVVRFLPDGSTQEVSLASAPSSDALIPGAVQNGWALTGVAKASFPGRDQMIVQRFDRSGAHVGEIARVEGMFRERTAGGSGPNPLSPRARFRAHGGSVYVAETTTPSIRVFGAGADTARVVTWDPGATPTVDDAMMRAAVDRAVSVAPAGQAASRKETFAGYSLPDRVSRFWDFLVDDLGFIWILPYDPAKHSLYGRPGTGPFDVLGAGGDWLILSPGGAMVGKVAMPADLEPTQITRDAVVGIARDELDVERVEVYPLERR